MDVHVTPGNVSDSEPILKRIDRIKETFNVNPKYLGLDAGYSTNPIFKGIIMVRNPEFLLCQEFLLYKELLPGRNHLY